MSSVTTPRQLDELFEQLGKAGFTWWHFRATAAGPDVLAGLQQHPRAEAADVFVLHHHELAHAYRAPTGPLEDVFRPDRVWWWFGGPPDQTVRALLGLPRPGASDAPTVLMPLPAPTGVPGELTPVRVQAPLWASARDERP